MSWASPRGAMCRPTRPGPNTEIAASTAASITRARFSIGPQLKAIFGGTWIANEGFDLASAEGVLAAGEADAVAFGKLFIANPDLPRRFADGAPLNAWNAATFYVPGPQGYTDYPALETEAA